MWVQLNLEGLFWIKAILTGVFPTPCVCTAATHQVAPVFHGLSRDLREEVRNHFSITAEAVGPLDDAHKSNNLNFVRSPGVSG